MLETLNPQPQDKILQLIAMFRDDPRDGKIDLGVGVYKDATGLTPVMRAVKAAEKRLWETEKTKSYTGLAGEPAFNAAMIGMILGSTFGDGQRRSRPLGAPGPSDKRWNLSSCPTHRPWSGCQTRPGQTTPASSNTLACRWQNTAISMPPRGAWTLQG